ncbi:ribonuclease Z [Candidatus Uabimicrobium sp. HlEnr_7]|uniref:ribonuclease Z n=1 Tax=Candidatus Uabimicrobium helgolandensis TaxID=3095367 RepID=UPI00355778FE
MSQRELTILGTSGQVPTRYRNHNGYLLKWDKQGFLFDPGEGIQRQMIYANVSTSAITKIFITHFHGDHCLGLAGLSQRISLDKVAHPIEIYYPVSGQEFYERLRKSTIFHDVAHIVDCPVSQEGVIFEDEQFVITAKQLSHSVDTFGYRIQEKDGRTMLPNKLAEYNVKGPSIGALQRDGYLEVDGKRIAVEDVSVLRRGQSMAFVMDTRVCQAAADLAENVDLLVCEATYLKQHSVEAKDRGHLTAEQAATIAKNANVRKVVLSHFSQRYPHTDLILQEAKSVFDHVHVAKDCEKIPMPKRQK